MLDLGKVGSFSLLVSLFCFCFLLERETKTLSSTEIILRESESGVAAPKLQPTLVREGCQLFPYR